MVSFDDILNAAVEKPTPHKDVVVLLRSDSGEREQLERDREALQERLAAAADEADNDPRLTSAADVPSFNEEFAALQERENELDARDAGHLVTLRVFQLPGVEWASLTAKHTNGFGGYDLNTVCIEAAQMNGVVVADGEEQPISEKQWDKLWGVLSGRSVDQIAAAVFELNVGDTAAEVQRLGKVSRPTPTTDSD